MLLVLMVLLASSNLLLTLKISFFLSRASRFAPGALVLKGHMMKRTKLLASFLCGVIFVCCFAAGIDNRVENNPIADFETSFSWTTAESSAKTMTYSAAGLVEGLYWDAPADANDPNVSVLLEWISPNGSTVTIASFATQDINDVQFKTTFETAASAADFKLFPCPKRLKLSLTLDDKPAAAYTIKAAPVVR